MVFNKKKWREKNKENIKEYNKTYRKENKEKCGRQKKEWRENNPNYYKEYRKKNKEQIKQSQQEYYQKNPERKKKQAKEWRKENPEKVKARERRYRKNNPEKLKAHKKANRKIKIPKGHLCDICGINLATQRHHSDYSKPLEVQFVCASCNNYWNERKREKLVFNKERIKDLKEKWVEYNSGWDSSKENIPKELYEIIEELIFRLEEKLKGGKNKNGR